MEQNVKLLINGNLNEIDYNTADINSSVNELKEVSIKLTGLGESNFMESRDFLNSKLDTLVYDINKKLANIAKSVEEVRAFIDDSKTVKTKMTNDEKVSTLNKFV